MNIEEFIENNPFNSTEKYYDSDSDSDEPKLSKQRIDDDFNLEAGTSPECSFEERRAERRNVMNRDAMYDIRIERLLPKNLRRRKYERVTDSIREQRDAKFLEIRKNPDFYRDRPGINTFLSREREIKSVRKDAKVKKIKTTWFKHHPWARILTKEEAMESKTERDKIIRSYYNKYLMADDPDLLANDSSIVAFMTWYVQKKNGDIEESDVEEADLEKYLSRKDS